MPKAAKRFRLTPRRAPRRRPPEQLLYHTPKWREARAGWLAKHPWCVECARHKRQTKANTVDHIRPHHGDFKLFWDNKNWQSLCQSCSSRKTAKQDGGFGNARVVSRLAAICIAIVALQSTTMAPRGVCNFWSGGPRNRVGTKDIFWRNSWGEGRAPGRAR